MFDFLLWEILHTSPIFVAQVGEPPQVSQPDQCPCYGQQKLQLARPLAAVQQLSLLHETFFLPGCLQAVSFKKFPRHAEKISRKLSCFCCFKQPTNKTKQNKTPHPSVLPLLPHLQDNCCQTFKALVHADRELWGFYCTHSKLLS